MTTTSPAPSGRWLRALYIRNFIFGGEDSLVSTVGLLSGIAAAGLTRGDIVLTGVVLIFVEALSMAVGSFLAENSAEEYLTRREVPAQTAIKAGLIMFVSYFLLGFVPLAPYLMLSVTAAFPVSIGASLLALWLLGYGSGEKFHVQARRSGLKMLVLGGLAIAIGIIVGRVVR
ncbi:MAG: VIT1/CCC1 transporter family protein [Candidatus Kerfeldbacteria bacterium]|nr:VIT1/CCC1 transporter family protein [Candidatus Kerfeldbacteria bacterium]